MKKKPSKITRTSEFTEYVSEGDSFTLAIRIRPEAVQAGLQWLEGLPELPDEAHEEAPPGISRKS